MTLHDLTITLTEMLPDLQRRLSYQTLIVGDRFHVIYDTDRDGRNRIGVMCRHQARHYLLTGYPIWYRCPRCGPFLMINPDGTESPIATTSTTQIVPDNYVR